MEYFREIYFYKRHFLDFYEGQDNLTQRKIEWTIQLLRTLKIIPEKYFKHIESTKGLYEIRVEVGGNIFRIFSFFDKGKLIILLNGFQKKSNKTPKKEIDKALKIMAEYYDEKKEN